MKFENKQKTKYEEYLEKASEVTPSERKYSLESSINSLIKTDNTDEQKSGYPFLGSILQVMNIRYDETIPTAGVCYNKVNKKYEMMINPYFFCRGLTHLQRRAVLLHEMMHVTFKHVFFETPDSINKMQLNFAMDLVINQFIKDLPDFALTIDKFRTKDGKPFPANKATEIYYELLNNAETKNPNFDKSKQDNKGKGDGDSQGSGSFMDSSKEWVDVQEMFKKKEAVAFDDHDWNDSDADKQEKLEALSDLIKRTIIKSSQSYSTIPDHVKDLLKEIEVQLAKLNYKQILLSTLKKSLPAKDTRQTWKRPSRRYGKLAKGNLPALMPKIEVFIDTSGSISHEEVNEFFKITNNFLTVGVDKCNINFFHTIIYRTEKIRKGFKIEANTLESGGTDLAGVFERIKKIQPDLSIIITDGYYGGLPEYDNKKMPQMVFVISKGGNVEHPLKNHGSTVKYGD
jgi:predicted metal-dependent peptidase